ncbi:TonB-dependent receptor plug domain-containing protein [Myroides sp. LJL110]
MKKILFLLLSFLSFIGVFAQHSVLLNDTTSTQLQQINLVVKKQKELQGSYKKNATIDEILADSPQISFIKKGAYAFEPLLNNMSSERSSITIDGMHIFGACVDKMDPVSSYLETNNISSIEINSGQKGNSNGPTLAGNIDFKTSSLTFYDLNTWNATYQTGFEFNNKQYYNLAQISFGSKRFAISGSFSYRKADNYTDGNNKELQHSQYKKLNASLKVAYKTSPGSKLQFETIFDQAKDVGFAALPMDLWLSRAMINALNYDVEFENRFIDTWQNKLYFNAVEHYMDDTKRPENLVHMDMPGWSTTYGLLSAAKFNKNNYYLDLQLNAYQNLSIAEMHMYPLDSSKPTMFAYSWPYVTTKYAGVSLNNTLELTTHSQLNLGASLGVHYNYSKYSEFNKIFYPESSNQKTRFLPSIQTSYTQNFKDFSLELGTGYAHRAPSVSEGYGYYIYNSYDRYDYIGNPDLKNEISYELNFGVTYKSSKAMLQTKVNYFHIQNYIVGEILSLGSPMNYQSVGVKGYTSLKYATIFNISFTADYKILANLNWRTTLLYARAKDNKGVNLPFIRPLHFNSALQYHYKTLVVKAGVNSDARQKDFSPTYGENQASGYVLFDASMDYGFYLSNYKLTLEIGVENLFNKYYTTYADWGNIPRMGRNVFTSLKFVL